MQTRSRKHCCSGKAVCIKYSECVYVALAIEHAKHVRRTYYHLCLVRLYHIFPHYLINGKIFVKKKFIVHKVVF